MRLPQALRPDPDQARTWLEAELSRPEYQESLQERFQRWLSDLLSGITPGRGVLGWLGILLVFVCVVVVFLALSRMRGDRRVAASGEAGLLDDHSRTAEDYLRLAEEALGRSDLAQALLHAFRAAAARGRDRGGVPITPADTADEAARRMTAAYPAESAVLDSAAHLFDATRYGTRVPSRDEVDRVLALEERLRRTRAAIPTPVGVIAAGSSASSSATTKPPAPPAAGAQ